MNNCLLSGKLRYLKHTWFITKAANDDTEQWTYIKSAHYDMFVNTLKQRQNGHHFLDDIFKYIFLNANVWILIKISLKFVPKGH